MEPLAKTRCASELARVEVGERGSMITIDVVLFYNHGLSMGVVSQEVDRASHDACLFIYLGKREELSCQVIPVIGRLKWRPFESRFQHGAPKKTPR
jgi:hypothetical protein